MAASTANRQRPPNTPAAFQKILDENAQLIHTISEFQQSGRVSEIQQLQDLLHRNLVQLATAADPGLLPELQLAPLSELQSPTQSNVQRRDNASSAPNEVAANTGAPNPQVEVAPTPTDKENRPAGTFPQMDSSRTQHGSSATPGNFYSSGDGQSAPPMVSHAAPVHPAPYEQQPSGGPHPQTYGTSSQSVHQMQQPLSHQHMGQPQQPLPHQGPPQQVQPATALQQQLQHATPSTGYSQPTHQYYGQPHYQQAAPYQQQMVNASGGGNYSTMPRPYQASGPTPSQQSADGGYYGASPQQRYQYPMTSAPPGQHSVMYQQQSMPPPAGHGPQYGAPVYQQQGVRNTTAGYGQQPGGYPYPQQTGGNVEPQPQHQMGPPQNYPQQYHQGNYPQPQVTSAQQIHYPATNPGT